MLCQEDFPRAARLLCLDYRDFPSEVSLTRKRTKRIRSIAVLVFLLAALSLAYREYNERRMIREEEALKNLAIGPIEFTDATCEDALRILVEKLHAMGHPEVQLHMYSDAHQVPYFHTEQDRHRLLDAPPQPITFRLGDREGEAFSLGQLLTYIGILGQSTCDLRGHDLVVVPTIGTMERFHKRRFKFTFSAQIPNNNVAAWMKSNGVTFYDGMTIESKPKDSEIEIYAPESVIDMFDQDAVHQSFGDRLRYAVLAWRMRLLGF